MTQEEINEILDAAKPKVIEALQKSLTESIDYQVRSKAINAISEHVEKWVLQNIIPEITKQLTESKESLISTGISIAPAIVSELAKALTDKFKKTLETDYKRSELFKAMFGGC